MNEKYADNEELELKNTESPELTVMGVGQAAVNQEVEIPSNIVLGYN